MWFISHQFETDLELHFLLLNCSQRNDSLNFVLFIIFIVWIVGDLKHFYFEVKLNLLLTETNVFETQKHLMEAIEIMCHECYLANSDYL